MAKRGREMWQHTLGLLFLFAAKDFPAETFLFRIDLIGWGEAVYMYKSTPQVTIHEQKLLGRTFAKDLSVLLDKK